MVQDTVRCFVEKEVPKENVVAWDKKGEFSEGSLDKMAGIGLMGTAISEAYGGTAGGLMEKMVEL